MNVGLQQTRRYILEILRETGEATVDEIVARLHERRGKDITPVTVRHHLNLLQQDELIVSCELRRKSSPGRPQHIYALTEKAKDLFPHNYERLVSGLITQLEQSLPAPAINVIFEGMAKDLAGQVDLSDLSLEQRLVVAVEQLNRHGYDAYVESCAEGYLLHTRNCPYHQVAHSTRSLCDMDMRLVALLTGIVPRLASRMTEGASTCSYLLPLSPDAEIIYADNDHRN